MNDTEGTPPPPPLPPPRQRQDLPRFLVLLLGVVGLLTLAILIFRPFAAPIVLALVLSTVAYPLFQTILRWVGPARRGVAAFLTCLALVLLVFVPLVWLGWSLVLQAGPAVEELKKGTQDVESWVDHQAWVRGNPQMAASWKRTKRMLDWFQGDEDPAQENAGDTGPPGEPAGAKVSPPGDGGPPEETGQAAGDTKPPGKPAGAKVPPPGDGGPPEETGQAAVEGRPGDAPAGGGRAGSGDQSFAGNIVSWLWTSASSILSNAFEVGVKAVVMLYLLFFFFKDGPRLALSLKRAIPLQEVSEDRIWRVFRQVSRSIIRGSFGTAAIQGVIAGIAFAIVGIQPVFWGVATGIASLIPPLGTALVLVPATLYQFFSESGSVGSGIFLIVVTALVGVLDNIIRPYLMGGGVAAVHEIWLLLSILGGLSFFGPMGLIYGPMVLVFLGTFVRLFVEEERQAQEPTSGGPAGSPGVSPPPPG